MAAQDSGRTAAVVAGVIGGVVGVGALALAGAYLFAPRALARAAVFAFPEHDERRDDVVEETDELDEDELRPWAVSTLPQRFAEGIGARAFDFGDGRFYNRWELGDAYERNAEHPDTFEIPSADEVDALQVGDLVKLMFEVQGTIRGEYQNRAERMWVIITRIDGDDFVGELDNDPFSFRRLMAGDTIRFSKRHIIDYSKRGWREERALGGESLDALEAGRSAGAE